MIFKLDLAADLNCNSLKKMDDQRFGYFGCCKDTFGILKKN